MPISPERLSLIFKALAHPVRLQILSLLREGEVCVCTIEAALDKRQAYISQQLMMLREAGVVDARKDGLKVFYRICEPVMLDILDATQHIEASVAGHRVSQSDKEKIQC